MAPCRSAADQKGRIGGGTDTASRDRYYHCFEWILVLADGTRRYVMTNGEPSRAFIDAGSIAALAEIPVREALDSERGRMS